MATKEERKALAERTLLYGHRQGIGEAGVFAKILALPGVYDLVLAKLDQLDGDESAQQLADLQSTKAELEAKIAIIGTELAARG